MLDVAFVILRELSELLLILLAVGRCLKGTARQALQRVAVAAAFMGCALGWGVMAMAVQGEHGLRVEAAASVLLGAATLWMANAMLFSARAIQARVDDVLAPWPGRPAAAIAVVAYCGLAGMREGMEAFVLLRSVAADHGPAEVAGGIGLGVAAVAAACLAFRSLWGRLRLMALYRVSTLLLCFVSAKLIIGGLSQLLAGLADGPTGWAAPLVPGDDASTTRMALLITLWPALVFLRRWWRESERPA